MSTFDMVDFKKFVKAQPNDRRIRHGDGWCGCALGDWIGGKTRSHSLDMTIKVQHALQEFDHKLHYILANPCYAEDQFPNYGALALWLDNEHGEL